MQKIPVSAKYSSVRRLYGIVTAIFPALYSIFTRSLLVAILRQAKLYLASKLTAFLDTNVELLIGAT